MFSFLEKIQRLPKERRKLFAAAAASSLTFFIFAVWLVDLDRRFGASEADDAVAAEDPLRGDLSPFSTLKRSAEEFVEGAKERIQALEESAAAFDALGDSASSTATSSLPRRATSTSIYRNDLATSTGSTSRSDSEESSDSMSSPQAAATTNTRLEQATSTEESL